MPKPRGQEDRDQASYCNESVKCRSSPVPLVLTYRNCVQVTLAVRTAQPQDCEYADSHAYAGYPYCTSGLVQGVHLIEGYRKVSATRILDRTNFPRTGLVVPKAHLTAMRSDTARHPLPENAITAPEAAWFAVLLVAVERGEAAA
jgi:hypothetical protein